MNFNAVIKVKKMVFFIILKRVKIELYSWNHSVKLKLSALKYNLIIDLIFDIKSN